jgi:hypothetical protein
MSEETRERQAVVRTMRRDYWDEECRNRIAVCRTHDPETDRPQHFLLSNMLEEAGIQDGDEYEIVVTATDRKPHGHRRWIRTDDDDATFVGGLGGRPTNVRAETDDECLKRIEANG